jgi:hypothetical protein
MYTMNENSEGKKKISVPKNGPALLPPESRRLRHVKSIMARSLEMAGSKILMDSFFTLHEEGTNPADPEHDEQPFFVGEVVYSSNNPHWCSIAVEKYLCKLDGDPNVFMVYVWDCTSKPYQLCLKSRVDLSTLQYIGADGFEFPPNSLLFELTDGLYITEDLRSDMTTRGIIQDLPITSKLFDENSKKLSHSRAAVLDIVQKKKELVQCQEEITKLKEKIEQKLKSQADYYEKIKERDSHLDRFKQLSQQVTLQKQHLAKELDSITTQEAALVPQVDLLKEAEIALGSSKTELEEHLSNLSLDKEKLWKTQQLIRFHTIRCIMQLQRVYVIKVRDDGIHTINGIPLPNSVFTGSDEEQVAVALGYVCHILTLLSKYLEIPMRYQMHPMCSKSMIRDDISPPPLNGKYPLYSKGVDRTRFEYGVFLLNKNLEQLLHAQDLETRSLRETLPNLHLLLASFHYDPLAQLVPKTLRQKSAPETMPIALSNPRPNSPRLASSSQAESPRSSSTRPSLPTITTITGSPTNQSYSSNSSGGGSNPSSRSSSLSGQPAQWGSHSPRDQYPTGELILEEQKRVSISSQRDRHRSSASDTSTTDATSDSTNNAQ